MNTELSSVLRSFDVLQLMTGPAGIDDGRVAVFGRAALLGLSGINRTGSQGHATVVLLPSLHPGLTQGRAFGTGDRRVSGTENSRADADIRFTQSRAPTVGIGAETNPSFHGKLKASVWSMIR